MTPANREGRMTEAQLYEKVGRQQVLIESQDAAYTALIRLLAQVVSGEVARDRVTVNLAARTWAITPAEQAAE
jgi:hypothetical protein